MRPPALPQKRKSKRFYWQKVSQQFPAMSSPCTARLNPALITSTGELQQILQDQEPFRTVYQREGSEQLDDTEKELIHTLNQAFQLFVCRDPPQTLTPRPPSAPAALNLAKTSDTQLSAQLRRMIGQELRRKYTKRSYEATEYAVKNALSNLFNASTPEKEEGMKEDPRCYIETIITTIAQTRSLNEVSDRSIKRWMQTTIFMDAFT